MKDIFGLFGKAWQKAAKIETAVNFFTSTGIYPLNKHNFEKYFKKTKNSSSVPSSVQIYFYIFFKIILDINKLK